MNTIAKSLDREFLSYYYKEMVDEIGEIFQLFLQEMPADFALLKESVDNRNYAQVAEVLHKIAPCFYNIGLPQLTKDVKEMEASIQARDLERIPERISAFQEEYNEYLPAIIEESNRLNISEV